MKPSDFFLRLPRVSDLMRSVVKSLDLGDNILLIVPPGYDVGAIRAEIYGLMSWHNLPLERLIPAPGAAPIDTILQAVGIAPAGRMTVEKLIAHAQMPLLLTLDDFAICTPQEIKVWFELMNEWARYTKILRDRGDDCCRLLFIATADQCLTDLPATNLFLQIIWWYSLPSILEGHLLCRTSHEDLADGPQQRWLEALIPMIALNDVALFDALSHNRACLDTFEMLCSFLHLYHEQSPWLSPLVLSAPALPRFSHETMLSRFNASERTLWAQGVLSHTPEYGWEVHSALLAGLPDKSDLSYRYWRGQAQLLLPLVEQVRLYVIKSMSAHLGTGWVTRWISTQHTSKREEISDDPYSVEWGQLRYLFRHPPTDFPAHLMPLKALVNKAWSIRNDIAHYKPITYQSYKDLSSFFHEHNGGVR
jgi:hypothetical protein